MEKGTTPQKVIPGVIKTIYKNRDPAPRQNLKQKLGTPDQKSRVFSPAISNFLWKHVKNKRAE